MFRRIIINKRSPVYHVLYKKKEIEKIHIENKQLKQTIDKANDKIKELRDTIWYFCLPCILLLAFTKK